MSKLDTDTAIAILQANVKRAKKKAVSVTLMAKACHHLIDEFKDPAKVGKLVNLSNEMIREFCLIDSLPKEVKRIIDKNQIRIDAARRIASIKGKTRQIQTAHAIAGLASHDARVVIDYLIKNKKAPVKQSKTLVLDTKSKVEESNIIVIGLNKEKFSILNNEAKKNKMTPGKFAKKLLEEMLIHSIRKLKHGK